MITPNKAKQDYEMAISVLGRIATAPETSPAERKAAREAAEELTVKFLESIEVEINALTSQYQTFITSMTGLIAKLGAGTTPVGALNQLTNIVNTGAKLVGVAKGEV